MMNDFDLRGNQYYRTTLRYPQARQNELIFVKKWLKPKRGEKILDLGCGTGYVTSFLANQVGSRGKIFASDISTLMLKKIKNLNRKNIIIIKNSEKKIPIPNKSIDTIFSYTAFHHFKDQAALTKECFRLLKHGGRMLIFDITKDSPVSKYADDLWGKYCITGHEGKWLSKEYIDTLCYLAGFKKPKIIKGNTFREFNTLKDVGIFFKNLHSLSCSEKNVLVGLKKYLGIKKRKNKYIVPWRIDIAITSKP